MKKQKQIFSKLSPYSLLASAGLYCTTEIPKPAAIYTLACDLLLPRVKWVKLVKYINVTVGNPHPHIHFIVFNVPFHI